MGYTFEEIIRQIFKNIAESSDTIITLLVMLLVVLLIAAVAVGLVVLLIILLVKAIKNRRRNAGATYKPSAASRSYSSDGTETITPKRRSRERESDSANAYDYEAEMKKLEEDRLETKRLQLRRDIEKLNNELSALKKENDGLDKALFEHNRNNSLYFHIDPAANRRKYEGNLDKIKGLNRRIDDLKRKLNEL